jgi:PBP1b-binding outer membrane lipoprotein LpoB
MATAMRIPLILFMLLVLAGCANEPADTTSTAPTKADIRKRDEFARNLPKPPER